MSTRAATWRAFIGAWDGGDPEWTTAERYFSGWNEARDWLAEWLADFALDDCDDCRARAADELARLRTAPAETDWFGEVEGDDYLIVHAPKVSSR